MMNVPYDARERGKMLAESIDMIERIWASDPPYDIGGSYWTTRIKDTINPGLNFGWLPKPYQKPRPPIAIPASTPDSASVKLAGRRGWSVISSQLLSSADLANHWILYRQGCDEAGRVANGDDWRICRSIHVAATDQRPARGLQRRERLSAFLRPHAQGLRSARPPPACSRRAPTCATTR
jgi:alkanesulfonate monooxygenase SsuD/methylene tetrahydromethanopterin reductase-like flavin-dependent oxidoreductase (luciferase family)